MLSTRSRFLEVESDFLLTVVGFLQARASIWGYTHCFIKPSNFGDPAFMRGEEKLAAP
jgi:hypothetical protein